MPVFDILHDGKMNILASILENGVIVCSGGIVQKNADSFESAFDDF